MARRKAEKGPSWFEVGLGAVLSIILGVALGALYMITKPVLAVKEIPKDAPSGQIYYIEGGHGLNKAGALEAKRKNFLAGESIEVDDSEINAALGGSAKSEPAAKPGDKAPAADAKMVDVGSLNARIHSGRIQFAAPVNFNVFSVMGTLIVQADGAFEKHGSTFTFVPDTVYVGSCPVSRIPFASDWVMSKLLFAKAVPDDMANAWSKLVSVSIEGPNLRLRTP